tara:strand:+ start:1352 stop:1549 length:198 start_codon:yes stop_codon:yes gene_type:complete
MTNPALAPLAAVSRAARDALDAAADDHAAASDDLIAALATMAALNDAEEGDALDDAEAEDEGGDA